MVFDFDSAGEHDFLVMEFVPGGTLASRLEDGPLALDEVRTIGAAVADALEEAHRQGVLHRDLKPANVARTLEGRPKLLDFGLALLQSGDAMTGRLTQAGTVVGSLAYMAPQQLVGDTEDARTDLYALGALLFELATGQRPFSKGRPQALMFATINAPAPSVRTLRPEAPVDFDRLVASCLEKDPARRPASAADVAAALRRIPEPASRAEAVQPARTPIRAVAVLPFRNVSQDPAQEYFANGMTEAVISELARIKALRVISRTSAMRYKGTTLSMPELGRELNVDAILEGSALHVEGRVRLNVQLVVARTDETLWADHYERQLENVLDLQSELAVRVAHEIAVQLTPTEVQHLARRREVNPEAHLQLLKSRHSSITGSQTGVDLGVKYARRALEIDPDLAAAWSALADCHIIRAVRGMAPPAEAAAEATAAAQRALELDPELADAHASLGIIQIHTGELRKGITQLRRAIELNPGSAIAHNVLARALWSFERHDEALASWAACETARQLAGGVANPSFGLAHIEAASGHVVDARRILGELTAARETRVVSAWGIAALHASLGEVDDAFRWLEIAVQEKASGLLLLRVHPRLDPIRSDPATGRSSVEWGWATERRLGFMKDRHGVGRPMSAVLAAIPRFKRMSGSAVLQATSPGHSSVRKGAPYRGQRQNCHLHGAPGALQLRNQG